MWALGVALVIAMTGDPVAADMSRVVAHDLGKPGEAMVAVVLPEPAARRATRASIFILRRSGWCRVAVGMYSRATTLTDRGGGNRAIRLIDRQERAVDLRWTAGRLVLSRNGRQLRTIDVPATGCD